MKKTLKILTVFAVLLLSLTVCLFAVRAVVNGLLESDSEGFSLIVHRIAELERTR